MRLPLQPLALIAIFALPSCSCRDDNVAPVDDGSEEEEPFENDFGQWLSSDVLLDGRPAIAYYDNTKGALGFAIGEVVDGAVTWTHYPIDGYAGDDGLDPGNVGQYASFAVAPDGTLWIAYYNATLDALYYARCSNGVWETGLADGGSGSSPDAGRWASLALDADGNPVIAHYEASDKELRVARWDGSAFSAETVDEGEDYEPVDTADEFREADVGQYARLLIEGGTEYIAYYDAANGDLKLATSSGGPWSVEVVDSDGDVGAWPSMALDGATLWIAYQDVGDQDLLITSGSGGAWSIETADSGEHVGADSEIYLDGDSPSVLYFDGQENDLKWTRRGASGWETPSVVTGAEGALGFHNETLLIGGARYAACYDYTHRTVWFSAI